jgi:short subunit dehydrogenase-like uncharacterized protein
MPGWLIYGANGYTGGLIAREAARRGHRPILAGRSAQAVAALAAELSLEHRVFSLDPPAALAQGIEGHSVVLHCAGPFAHIQKVLTQFEVFALMNEVHKFTGGYFNEHRIALSLPWVCLA